MLNNPKEAVEYAEESVNIVEQRADLKTHIENNDLTLLRYKLTYLISLQKNENWDLADKLMTELKEYDEYKPKAHESPIIEHIQPQGSFTCEIKILKKIQKIHNNRNSLEQTASEYSDDEVLELINQSLNEISEAIQEIEKCEEISPYWEAHLLGFMGYIYARKSDNYQSGKYYQESFELFEKIEKKYPISYYPFDEITDIAGGYFFNSVKSRLGYATSIEDDKKADKEFLKVVEMAEKKYPNDEHRTLTVALRKTGQRFSFPFRRNEEDCKRAIDLFKKGINVLEKEGDLEEFISNGDTTLLFFKDWLKSNLEHYGSKAESEEIKNEIKPYEEYISWRFERNPLTEEDE
jgi:tetratricopeptide (TPR) repeat protein